MADFLSTFHHDGKISHSWWGVEGACPPPFTIFTITYKVAVYAPAERADTHPPISSLTLYVLCGLYHRVHIFLEMKQG